MRKLFALTLPLLISFISILPMQAQSNITVREYLSVGKKILDAESNTTTDSSLLQARAEMKNVFQTYNNAIAQTVIATNQLSINNTGKPLFCVPSDFVMSGEKVKEVVLIKTDFHIKHKINLDQFFNTYPSFVAVQGLSEMFPCKQS